MRILLVSLTVFAVAYAAHVEVLDMATIIKTVNEANTTWTAGHNFNLETSLPYYKKLLGFTKNANATPLQMRRSSDFTIPREFDARKQWPQCPISHIRDQGDCGSCWAVSSAAAFSDRVCIASNGTFTTPFSAEELMTCCYNCGAGCGGGDPGDAWNHFVNEGLVTGGDYGSEIGCQPYSIAPCEHNVTGPRPPCPARPSTRTPECQTHCTNSKYPDSMKSDHHRAKIAYTLDSIEDAKRDIMRYGSIVAALNVYEDLITYKSGVYRYTTGKFLGGHAVRVIGWGEENRTPYWLVANSWNSDWGDKGFFKIALGLNECAFESYFTAGEV